MFSRVVSTSKLIVAVIANCAGLLALLAASWMLPGLIEVLIRQG